MSRTHRVLPLSPFVDLAAYIAVGGGKGLRAARAVEASVIIDELTASGLRGRGGAGFPTGVKWKTVFDYASDVLATSVVVNAAEGEPGTYKDRTILNDNPYAVVEGALIAARVVGARAITIATKQHFTEQIARLNAAIAEVRNAGWADDVDIDVVEGPGEYLYGEETALLEVLDGRPPLPRLAPPFRRGVVELVEGDDDVDVDSGLSADVEMAGADASELAPPALVDNVETLANVPGIISNGAAWFRELGTEASPGTIVCTVTGAVTTPGVAEMEMGTPLREVLAEIGGIGAEHGVLAVLMGASNRVVSGAALDTPITYEAMTAAGTGLGSASFIVYDDRTDPVAIAAGASRFLAIESCGQCTPCKQDGLEIAQRLDRMCRGAGAADDLQHIRSRLDTVNTGARCNLAEQQRVVVGSLLEQFPGAFEARAQSGADPVAPEVVAELFGIGEQQTTVDPRFLDKRPDWTYANGAYDIEEPSGAAPADRLAEHRAAPAD